MKTPTTMRNLCGIALGLVACGAGFPALADYSSTVLGKNPVGYWRFDQTNQLPTPAVATNYGSASAANGYYLNGVKALVDDALPATTDTAPSFDGFSQKVEVPFNAALNPGGAFTVEAWVRPMVIEGYDNKWYRAAVRNGTQQDGGGFQIQFDTGTVASPGVFKFTMWNGNSSLEVFRILAEAGNILATNNGPWFHLVGTWSSADNLGRIYVNGVELTNRAFVYTPNTNAPLRIGGGDIGPTDVWGQSFDPGPICKVAVYDTQLTPTQIAAHYDNGTNTAPGSAYSTVVAGDSPVGYWPLNESSIPAQPVLTNLGLAGTQLDGRYNYNSTLGVAGAQSPNYGGLETNNLATYISANGGSAWVPPVKNPAASNYLTITAWIKRNGNQMGSATILGRRVPGGEKSAFCFDGGGLNKLSYNWDDNANQYNFDTKLTVPDNVWTFAAMVITPTNAVVYMDYGAGLQWASNNFANTTLAGFTHELLIGPSGPYAGRRFNGTIDEVAVFTNALTAADLWDLRNAAFGSGLFLASQPVGHPVMLGGQVPFTAIAAGSTNYMPFSYQLLKNGSPVGTPGSSATIYYSNVKAADLGATFSINVLTNGGATASLTSSGVSLTRWTVPGEYSEVVENFGPAAYYRFSETTGTAVYDVAQALDGVTVGSLARTAGPVPTDFAGFLPSNSAYSGNGGYMLAAGPAISGSNVTICMWVNPNSGTQIPYSGLYYTRGADYAGFNYGPSGNTELGISWNGHYNDHSAVFVQPGVWNFIALVLGDVEGPTGPTNAATFYCYNTFVGWQSNSIYGAGGFPARNLAGGQGTAIGADPNTSLNRPAKGMIDEVAVINKTLSFDDINKLAMAGEHTHVSINPAAGTTYTVGWSYGTLESALDVNGPWTPVGGAVAPTYAGDSQAAPQKYFRVVP